ncbi:MAG: TonB family protein [Syntrophales bacterium]
MTAKKFLIPFVLASLAGHAFVLALTTHVDWAVSPPEEPTEKIITVEIKAPLERAAPRPHRSPPRGGHSKAVGVGGGAREGSVALQGEPSPYSAYLLVIRRKIERLWSYPPQALAQQEEGNAVIRFTIDADGSLSGYHIVTTSGSQALDEGTLAVVRAAAPYAPLPEAFNLSRLHITATFSYRMGE